MITRTEEEKIEKKRDAAREILSSILRAAHLLPQAEFWGEGTLAVHLSLASELARKMVRDLDVERVNHWSTLDKGDGQ